MDKKILIYLPAVITPPALQTARHIVDGGQLYAVEILTFQEIFSKVPMDEAEDVKNAYRKLNQLGEQLDVPTENQLVEIGNPGQHLISLIKKLETNILVTSEMRASQLSKANSEFIEKIPCKIIKIPL